MTGEKEIKIFGSGPYGFRIKGGTDFNFPIVITQVTLGGKADRAGLANHQHILSINGINFKNVTHSEAVEVIKNASSLRIFVNDADTDHSCVKLFNQRQTPLLENIPSNELNHLMDKKPESYLAQTTNRNCSFDREIQIKNRERSKWYQEYIKQSDNHKMNIPNGFKPEMPKIYNSLKKCGNIDQINSLINMSGISEINTSNEKEVTLNLLDKSIISSNALAASETLVNCNDSFNYVGDFKTSDVFRIQNQTKISSYNINGKKYEKNGNFSHLDHSETRIVDNNSDQQVNNKDCDSKTFSFFSFNRDNQIIDQNINELGTCPADRESCKYHNSDIIPECKSVIEVSHRNRSGSDWKCSRSDKLVEIQKTSYQDCRYYESVDQMTRMSLDKYDTNTFREENGHNGKIKCFSRNNSIGYSDVENLTIKYRRRTESNLRLSSTECPKIDSGLKSNSHSISTKETSKEEKKKNGCTQHKNNGIKSKLGSEVYASSNSSSSIEHIKNKIINFVKKKKNKSKKIIEDYSMSQITQVNRNKEPNDNKSTITLNNNASEKVEMGALLQDAKEPVFLYNTSRHRRRSHDKNLESSHSDKHVSLNSKTLKEDNKLTESNIFCDHIPCFAATITDHAAETPRELTFSKGSILHVLRKINSDWYEAEIKGNIGLVLNENIMFCTNQNKKRIKYSQEIIGIGVALISFSSPSNILLSYEKDDHLLVNVIIDDNWFEATTNNVRGIARRDHIQLIEWLNEEYEANNELFVCTEDDTMGSIESTAPHIKEELILFKCEANQDFDPVCDDEIPILKGDLIFALKYYSDGWGYGFNKRNGTEGMFPVFFTDLMTFSK